MILIIDMNYKKNSLAFDEFVMPIANIVKKNCKVKHYSEINEKEINIYDKIILSGTTLKDNEFVKHIKKFSWIKRCNKPILGICAGMEIIALVFDSKLIKSKEIGMTEVTTIKENKLFSSGFEAYELHNFGVEPSEEFDVLAESENCIQAIRHKEKGIYGVMFHPEVRNKEIIRKFAEL